MKVKRWWSLDFFGSFCDRFFFEDRVRLQNVPVTEWSNKIQRPSPSGRIFALMQWCRMKCQIKCRLCHWHSSYGWMCCSWNVARWGSQTNFHLAVVSSSKFNILGCQHMASPKWGMYEIMYSWGSHNFQPNKRSTSQYRAFPNTCADFLGVGERCKPRGQGKDKDHEDPRSQRGFEFDSTRSAGGNWDPVSLLPHHQGLEWQQSVTTWPRKSCYQGRHRLKDP